MRNNEKYYKKTLIKPSEEISEIIKNKLYLCGIHGLNKKRIINLNIKLILNVSKENGNFIDKNSWKNLKYDLEDDDEENIFKHFDEICNIINESGNQPVLIHCYAGKHRSVSFVIAYLMKFGHKQWNYKSAKEYVKRCRPVFDSLPKNYINQLLMYYDEIHKNNTYNVNKKYYKKYF